MLNSIKTNWRNAKLTSNLIRTAKLWIICSNFPHQLIFQKACWSQTKCWLIFDHHHQYRLYIINMKANKIVNAKQYQSTQLNYWWTAISSTTIWSIKSVNIHRKQPSQRTMKNLRYLVYDLTIFLIPFGLDLDDERFYLKYFRCCYILGNSCLPADSENLIAIVFVGWFHCLFDSILRF